MLTILVTFVLLFYLRKNLLDKAMKLDANVYTPSDFCLMGKNMQFDNYNPTEIEKAIRTEFRQSYDIDNGIVYVNAVYDIADFYQIFNK